MASVSATNPGVADLLQTLSNIDSPVVSSPAAIAALEKAPPTDIVQLSEAAMQLEGLDAMFGIQNGSNATGSEATNATNIEDLLNGAVAAAATSPGAAANAPGLFYSVLGRIARGPTRQLPVSLAGDRGANPTRSRNRRRPFQFLTGHDRLTRALMSFL